MELIKSVFAYDNSFPFQFNLIFSSLIFNDSSPSYSMIPQTHKVHLFQTINHLTRYRRRVSVDFNWPEWRGKISWIIRRLHVARAAFFILDKRWTLPRYDRAPECGATGVTSTVYANRICDRLIRREEISFPLPISFQRRFDRVEEDSPPPPPSVAKVATSYAVAFDFASNSEKVRPNRLSIADRWFLFGSRSTNFTRFW